MSAVRQVIGRKPSFGKQVPHSHRRTSRRWHPNPRYKRYWLPSENRWLRPRLSTTCRHHDGTTRRKRNPLFRDDVSTVD